MFVGHQGQHDIAWICQDGDDGAGKWFSALDFGAHKTDQRTIVPSFAGELEGRDYEPTCRTA